MLYGSAVSLVFALIAGVGFGGVAGTAVNIAWMLFVVGLILAAVFGVIGSARPSR